MTVTMMSRTTCLSKLNGQFHGKNNIFWLLRNTNFVVSHCRYLSENVIHSCGMTAYASVINPNTPTAPAMHSAHVAGRSGFGRLKKYPKIARPTIRIATAQIRRPAGRIHGNQSGIRLGIGPAVLRVGSGRARSWETPRARFLSRYRSRVPIEDRTRIGPERARRATMR